MTLLSAADGMVGKKRTPSRGGEQDSSVLSSCTACCLTSRGFDPTPIDCFPPTETQIISKVFLADFQTSLPKPDGRGVELPALDRDIRNVDVLAVVAEADESFRELDKFESCDVLRVISHDE